MIQIKRAILSVSDKTGLLEFGKFLQKKGVELFSTGGTLRALEEAGIRAHSIGDYTGFPEIMDGRVKTLHPKIHGGLLALEDRSEHLAAMQEHGILGFDLLVVNLYPFAKTIANANVDFSDAIENIDIGGPTMLRAGAKNYGFTAVVCDPADYPSLMQAMDETGGISKTQSLELARKVFNHTAAYDSLIAAYLNKTAGVAFPERLTLTYERVQPLRYGENPHQKAAFYRLAWELAKERSAGQDGFRQLQGKELSFNNLLDTSAALRSALSLPGPGIAIIKHLNPCGAAMVARRDATNEDLEEGELNEAFLEARACDPVSAFGGIIASTSLLDGKTAASISENFVEVIVAPAFSDEAREIFSKKKNLRLIEIVSPDRFLGGLRELRTTALGALYQDFDTKLLEPSDFRLVSQKKPDETTLRALHFAWRVCKNVKSNAILFTSERATLGIGAGQMSRIDSVEIAVSKAKKASLSLEGSVAASDAFFPFRDGIDALAKAGAKAVIQPGGSIRDEEVIAAADEHGIAMVFTGTRHFLH